LPLSMVVCAKQVPDTKAITSEAMKPDGTVNRTALPAIFNPEDLNALEMALELRDRCAGSVTVISMGPPRAADVLREALYRGADRAILVSDRLLAASDTLATSYALAHAVRKAGAFDLVLCGRQAIDGDTAQIGPQLAQKLAIPQFTYVVEVVEASDCTISVRRDTGDACETLEGPVPCLLTVVAEANRPRLRNAKLVAKYKKARSEVEGRRDEIQAGAGAVDALQAKGLLIEQWGVAELGAEPQRCGFSGSPTRVTKIDSVRLVAEDRIRVEATEAEVEKIVRKLISQHTIG